MRVEEASHPESAELRAFLVEALEDDPFIRWLSRPKRDPARSRASYVELMLDKIALPRGRVWTARGDEGLLGVALWAPPGTFALGVGDTLGVLPLMVDVVGFSRMAEVGATLDRIEEARPAEPRWLLTLVGTHRAARRRGVGRALLQPGLRACARESLPAVAETASADNLPFYRRLGFEVAAERALGPDGPTSWTLVRGPGEEPPGERRPPASRP